MANMSDIGIMVSIANMASTAKMASIIIHKGSKLRLQPFLWYASYLTSVQ